ncbi:MAG: hypothetical protein K2N58_03050 [Treponemataceae bacterium]|nr:hypothetical protein [Treponemataceae bacterium]
MKKLLILLFVFGMFFGGCDLVYVNIDIDETEKNINDTTEVYLLENIWMDGKISKNEQRDTYYISVTKGTRYFIYMNNAYDGEGTKNAQTDLKISYSDGTIICDNNGHTRSLYSKPYTFVASSTGTVTIIALAGGYTGTYAVKYTSKTVEDYVLSEGEWKADEIIADGQTNRYSINAIAGMRYFIYMNNSYDGDGTKFAKTGLKIFYSDSTIICDNYDNAKSLYSNPYTFVAQSTSVVTITVAVHNGYSSWECGTGTYAIKYTSQPEYYMLSEGEWKDDDIIAKEQTNKYSINVTAGTLYFIYMNNVNDGDGTKTAHTGLKISYSDGTIINDDISKAYELYKKPYTFIALNTGIVTITIVNLRLNFGTYAIKYISQTVEDYVLSEGEWKTDEIIADGQTNKYIINVTSGMRYFIYKENMLGSIGLKISHSDGTILCDSYDNTTNLYSTPYTFVAPSSGTVTITVAVHNGYSSWECGTGIYAIKYTSRSEYYMLSEGEWKDDDIVLDGQTNRYSINVIAGTRYYIYMDNQINGGTKSARTGLKISHSDGTIICDSYDNATYLYFIPYSFIASSTGTVTITAAATNNGYWEQGTGTYAIKYTSRTNEAYVLSEGEWKDDDIMVDGQTNKYSINVIKGKWYFIYMNNKYDGDGTKTAYTSLKISNSDGNTICDSYERKKLYSLSHMFIAPSTGMVTISVAAESSYHSGDWEQGIGTYAIKYTSRTVEDYILSEGEWKDDDIKAYGQTNRYTINVIAGTRYFIYMKNAYESYYVTKTACTGLKIFHSDGTIICDSYDDATRLCSNPYTFVASSTGTVTIIVAAFDVFLEWERGTGTYAIKYTEGN